MVYWFEEIKDQDREELGEKASNLGKLMEHEVDVPYGFAVGKDAFETFLRENQIKERIEKKLREVNPDDLENVKKVSEDIQNLIRSKDITEEDVSAIKEAYGNINISRKVRNAGNKAASLVGGQRETEFVAVRASPIGGNSSLYKTKIGVNGKDSVVETIKEVWASFYSPEAIFYRKKKRGAESLGIIVQKMEESDVSGSLYTSDPLTGQESVVIEAVYGIGSSLKEGAALPDRFLVEKSSATIRSRDIAEKKWKIERDPKTGKTVKKKVPSRERDEKTLTDQKVNKILEKAKEVERILGEPQKIDFSLKRGQVSVISSRKMQTGNKPSTKSEGEGFIQGFPASTGIGVGEAKIVYDAYKVGNPEGRVILCSKASKKLITSMEKASAIVTDRGGISSSAAVLARKFHIPMLVGCQNATDRIGEGEEITADCNQGKIIKGSAESSQAGGNRGEGAERKALTGTEVLEIEEEPGGKVSIEKGKSTRWSTDSFREDSKIYRSLSGIEGGAFLMDSYRELVDVEEAVEKGAEQIIIDGRKFDSKIGKVLEVVKSQTDADISLIAEESTEGLYYAIESGLNSIITPESDRYKIEKRLEKAERRFILKKLRELE
ncbi:MAG: PEP-utilizing enzyme [Candidatus Nanohaloarchaeota archaeon QJJ-9]|nr:PEP-utilizing enzyme [Candidatus Nanohaloarchaeota archaeon QJJ-9]